MEVEFSGAAREVTGSCHIVRANGKTVLLDCGKFQGKRKEFDAKYRRLPPRAAEVDAVVLSHAHIDHAGRLPCLIREGYQGTIWATAATRDLSAVMLADSAGIQEMEHGRGRWGGHHVRVPPNSLGRGSSSRLDSASRLWRTARGTGPIGVVRPSIVPDLVPANRSDVHHSPWARARAAGAELRGGPWRRSLAPRSRRKDAERRPGS
jgi:hypothetical protein